MKRLILFTFLASSLLTTSAFAFGTVYCKDDARKLYNAASEQGLPTCAGALAHSNACFTGQRADVIKLINDGTFTWDDVWLEGAYYKGRNDISHLLVDGPNKIQDRLSMVRCTSEFFRP